MAGAKAAETLRAEGFDGRVVLVGQERAAPYERPPLSKSYLMGQSPFEEARVHPDGFYEEQRIELETGSTAMALDVAAHTVTLDGDRRLTYDRLLLATGAVPRRAPPGGRATAHGRPRRTAGGKRPRRGRAAGRRLPHRLHGGRDRRRRRPRHPAGRGGGTARGPRRARR